MTVIVPSRGRPANVLRLARAFDDMATGTTELCVVVDDDDPELTAYVDLQAHFSLHVIPKQPRPGMVDALNYAAVLEAQRVDYIAFMGDDHVPRTLGWDTMYVERLEQLGTGMVYGDDLLQHEAMPTQIAMTADIVRALGWMAPPALEHLCVDIAWLELGELLGCIEYMPDVIVEHLHPAVGKADWDERYAAVNAPEVMGRDGAAFYAWRDNDLKSDVAKVVDACAL